MFPLISIAFSYNSISAEWERGTLRLLLARPRSLLHLSMAKALFRYGLVTGLTLLISAAALLWAGAPVASGDFAAFALALYSQFWFALAFLVHLAGFSSSTDLLLLLGAWLLGVLIIPNVVNMTAGSLHPVPSRVELVNAYRDAELFVEGQKEILLTQYYAQHPQQVRKPEAEKDWRDYYRERLFLDQAGAERKAAVDAHFARQLISKG